MLHYVGHQHETTCPTFSYRDVDLTLLMLKARLKKQTDVDVHWGPTMKISMRCKNSFLPGRETNSDRRGLQSLGRD